MCRNKVKGILRANDGLNLTGGNGGGEKWINFNFIFESKTKAWYQYKRKKGKMNNSKFTYLSN
jgi:hypothetical protein